MWLIQASMFCDIHNMPMDGWMAGTAGFMRSHQAIFLWRDTLTLYRGPGLCCLFSSPGEHFFAHRSCNAGIEQWSDWRLRWNRHGPCGHSVVSVSSYWSQNSVMACCGGIYCILKQSQSVFIRLPCSRQGSAAHTTHSTILSYLQPSKVIISLALAKNPVRPAETLIWWHMSNFFLSLPFAQRNSKSVKLIHWYSGLHIFVWITGTTAFYRWTWF